MSGRIWPAALGALLLLAIAPAGSSAESTRTAEAGPPLGGVLAENFILFDPPHPTPETPFYDGANAALSFADYRGRVLVVNFWATWCGPCIREMPTLDRLQAAFAGEDVAVLALSQDFDGLKSVPPFLAEHGLDNLDPIIDKRGAVADEIGIIVLPTTLVIDRAGRIVGGLEGPAEWDTPEVKALIRYYLERRESAQAG